jgi:glycogen(starch) synthase
MGLERRGPRWHRLRLRWLLACIRPDIVHVHWAHFASNIAAVWKGPLVVTAWGSDIYRPEQFDADDLRMLGPALRRAELLTCNSNDLAEHIHHDFNIPRQRVEIIQWGVDTELFRPEGPNLRSQFGLSDREVVFSARNFSMLHNQETVVAAFALLRQRRPKAFLLMKYHRGEADYLARIRSQIESLGLRDHVRIVDSVAYEEMPQLYRTAEVIVSVAPSDGTPTCLLESMAAGVPCVVSDIAPLREWVREGETGYLVDPLDPAAVASALELALDGGEVAKHIKDQARRVAVERASQDAHMAAMGRLYGELAEARGKPQARLGPVGA